MRHDIRLDGFAYALRPLDVSDAEAIIDIRTAERSRYMNQIDRSVDAQRQWIERYLERPDEYCFVVERKHTRQPEALSSLLTPDRANRSIQWGRFVVRAGSRASTESGIFMHRVAFDILGFEQTWGILLADNAKMRAYLESIGHDCSEKTVSTVDGRTVDAIRDVMKREWCRSLEKPMTDKALQIAAELDRSLRQS